MIFEKPPADFNPKFSVSACFIISGKEFIFLKTGSHKKLGGLWGVPAGKLNLNETPLECVIREIKEETQIELNKNSTHFFKTVYIRYPELDYIYHMFYTTLDQKSKFQIDPRESEEGLWVTREDALKLPLIPDEEPCIEMFKSKTKLI